MLVLTRKDGETIHIGDDIEITVVECHRDAVRIGIDAPRSMSIKRGELVDPTMVPKPKAFKRARLEAEAARAHAAKAGKGNAAKGSSRTSSGKKRS